jgi:hypothetical protein
MIGAKLDSAEWQDIDLEEGQTINLADHFDCSKFSGSRNPQLKHCPVGGRNSAPFSAIIFQTIHSNAIAGKVSYKILTQIKELCKEKKEIIDMDDFKYLDVRYSRKSGYVLNALSTQFSNVMRQVLAVASKLDLAEYGTHKTLSTSAASTHYLALAKKDDNGSKGIMFNIPLECDETEVKKTIIKVYEALTGMSEGGRTDMQRCRCRCRHASAEFERELDHCFDFSFRHVLGLDRLQFLAEGADLRIGFLRGFRRASSASLTKIHFEVFGTKVVFVLRFTII